MKINKQMRTKFSFLNNIIKIKSQIQFKKFLNILDREKTKAKKSKTKIK